MALKPHVLDNQRREKKQRQYQAAPELAKAFPTAKEVVFEFRFVDPEGKVSPSPYKRIFTPDMQAFFDFPCPLKDCDGGGIALSHTVARKLQGSRSETNQMQVCKGNRKREGAKGKPYPCGLEMHYRLSVNKKSRQAA